MTDVRAYFTKELVEELELDVPAEEIDGPTVADALASVHFGDNVRLDDFEIVREIE